MPVRLSDAVAVPSVRICIPLHFRVHLSSFVQNEIAIVALWVTWGCVIYGRLYLGEHTVAQVIVGIAVGCVYGLGWYGLDISVVYGNGFDVDVPLLLPFHIAVATLPLASV